MSGSIIDFTGVHRDYFSPRTLEKCYSNHDCQLEHIYSSTCTPYNSPSRSRISTHGRSLIDGAKNSFHCFVFTVGNNCRLVKCLWFPRRVRDLLKRLRRFFRHQLLSHIYIFWRTRHAITKVQVSNFTFFQMINV